MMAASTTDQSISVAVQVDLINGIDEKRECVYKYFTLLPRSLRICHSNVFLEDIVILDDINKHYFGIRGYIPVTRFSKTFICSF